MPSTRSAPEPAPPPTDAPRSTVVPLRSPNVAPRAPPAAVTFTWDGNRLLSETSAGRQQLYVYAPGSFAPLVLVRSRVPEPAEEEAAEAPLPPELLTLRDEYPAQWEKILAARRKLAHQLGQAEAAPAAPPPAEVFYIHTDHLGTPREVTDADGHLVWYADYKAWGRAQTHNPAVTRTVQDGSALREVSEPQADPVTCPLRFQGQYLDPETGLHYNRFRYYDPDVGRFASQDPIGLAGGANGYKAFPSPTGYVDPLGLMCKPCPSDPCARRHGIPSSSVVAPAKRNLGVTVLGHYPAYTDLANELGARYFFVPDAAWKRLERQGDPWIANKKFLDRTVLRGDQILLATPLDQVKPGSYFERELRYLKRLGFTLCPDGMTLQQTK